MKDKILFYKSNDPYGFLNNFCNARMYVYGYWWNNIESAYQAQKTANVQEYKAIRLSKSPREAFNLGQKVTLPSNWNEIKDEVMFNCVFAKFSQHHDLLIELIKTHDSEIIENSPIDSYWGWGADHNGQNKLGKILMKVRKILIGFDPQYDS